MKYQHEIAFIKANMFGKGKPNTSFAQYFIGESFLNSLTDFRNGEFPLFNVTFEPGCRYPRSEHLRSMPVSTVMLSQRFPNTLSDEEAACVPLIALTALQSLELMDPKAGESIFRNSGFSKQAEAL